MGHNFCLVTWTPPGDILPRLLCSSFTQTQKHCSFFFLSFFSEPLENHLQTGNAEI